MSERVLAIYPHPDDETFGKGGALALHVMAGDSVTVACGTLGQMGRNMGKPFFANRETLSGIRETELRNACKALGVRDLRLLGLHDKMIEFEDPAYVEGMILDILRDVKPTRVYSYYPEHGVHPDHDALAAFTVNAIAQLPPEERPVVYASAITRNREEAIGPPQIEVDVTSVYKKKLDAMRAHRSQSEANLKRMESRIQKEPEKREEIEAPLKKEHYWILTI